MSNYSLPKNALSPDEVFLSLLNKLCLGQRLNTHEIEQAFGIIVEGGVSPERIAAFLAAMRVQGEGQAELLGAVRALRARMISLPTVPPDTIDVCGTGGDNYGTLNISTATAFVLAALGIPVAKHGNRAVSSRTGASDVLAALGIEPLDNLEALSNQLTQHHLTFLAAPHHHPAMRHAAPVRKALGIRTLFNLVGPLVNPASVQRQLVGVFSAEWLDNIVDVLSLLGSHTVWAVCGQPEGECQGIDEITLAGPTQVVALDQGQKYHFTLTPEMAGLRQAPISDIKGDDATYNAQALLALLNGASGAYRDTVVLNAACALHVAGRTKLLTDGKIDTTALKESVSYVSRPLDDGSALAVLTSLRTSSASTHAPNVTG
ncbi:anthranilate phosphoribosyltransferase [Acetobacter cibinongensis]|uniref:Anthranilate phosphoribosyltransferase n=1 Tax=Acetobacter cibinongensis TaxID=146475 RepID=A0A0D6N6H6_9PROT|nr:anthranilate phosphoribosyltransferase [Acetobacter cibinongensis]GAN61173.1 anthranilate phosphoribosyltransferase TrpD [Acetobacter cibinongensis]GBQ17413.1 anthranilate phosphoribosyltransferase [Acetobacter cibinongensis NRIC 0482]GEL57933.1 anthranilate phosphoribosyltransferase [Acetobacter cibinongensis]